MPEPIPAVLIGRLALDKAYRGKGYGVGLLRDAVLRIAGASQTIGIRAILVHAKSDSAKAFMNASLPHLAYRADDFDADD